MTTTSKTTQNIKVGKKGLAALAKSPANRNAIERKQAKKAERALKQRKAIEKEKERAEKKRIKAELIKLSRAIGPQYTGLKRYAYKVKMFWKIPGSKPAQFYRPGELIDLTNFDILKAATIELAEKCVDEYEQGDKAIALLTLLDSPPPRTKRASLAVNCRQFADLILDILR